jgi:hypothetical protein
MPPVVDRPPCGVELPSGLAGVVLDGDLLAEEGQAP